MEVTLCVPTGTDMGVINHEYPDIYEDGGYDDHQRFFVGRSAEDDDDEDPEGPISESFLTRDGAIECCGFCEGAVEGCETLIEGNGGWAQGLLGREDFSSWACEPAEIENRLKDTERWKAAFAKGQAAAAAYKEGQEGLPQKSTESTKGGTGE